MQQRKSVKVQDSHPHNQHIRGATVVLNLYIIMYQSSINVTPTLLSLQYLFVIFKRVKIMNTCPHAANVWRLRTAAYFKRDELTRASQ